MKFKKILVVGIAEEQLDASTWKIIRSFTGNCVPLSANSPDLYAHLHNADALLVYFNKADKEMIDRAPNLKYIGALATGVGKIDSVYAARKKIIVTNVPGYSTESVAEFVFAVLLEHLREIARAKIESKEGNRSESGFRATEIKGKKFGVLGAGRIGARVAEIANSFGADSSYWSRRRKKELEKRITYQELDKVLAQSDILSIHMSLYSETENILNKEKINKIKRDAIVINTAPMELLDFAALERRIKDGDIVFIFDHTDTGDISEEKLKRLQQYKNCITYPAIGYVSDEARVAKQEIFINNIRSFLRGKPVNIVKPA